MHEGGEHLEESFVFFAALILKMLLHLTIDLINCLI